MVTNDWESRFGLQREAAQQIDQSLAALDYAQGAIHALERFLNTQEAPARQRLSSGSVITALVRLAFSAPFLIRHLGRNPKALESAALNNLEDSSGLLPWSKYHPGFPADEDTLISRLRHWKYDNYARITAQELCDIHPTRTTCRLISELADGLISLAFRFVFHQLATIHGAPTSGNGRIGPGAVIGMGKLGGKELNYASDIDLIFFHDAVERPCQRVSTAGFPDPLSGSDEDFWAFWNAVQLPREGETPESDESISGGEFYNKLAQRTSRLISVKTADGIGFRVDLDLRPQGKSGILSPSLDIIAQYYDVHGREWERCAMIKARKCAGDHQVWERFLKIITPFVYRRYLDFSAVEGIALIKHDIDLTHSTVLGSHIKLGRGGIRENEFLVQALQLLYGGKRPELRETSHQKALEMLEQSGIMEPGEARQHLEDYWLLRKWENRIQMADEAQTHNLPEEPEKRLAVFHDFKPDFPQRLSAVEQTLADSRKRNSENFQALFRGAQSDTFLDPETWQQALKDHLPESEQERMLVRVSGLIDRLMKTRQGERCVFKLGKLLTNANLYRRGIDEAFPRWMEFLEQIGNRNAIHALMDQTPSVVDWVSTIFAEGGKHAQLLIRHPQFLESYLAFPIEESGRIQEIFSELLVAIDDEEEFILELQMAKSQISLQILASFLHAPEQSPHTQLLSELAEAIIMVCTRFAWKNSVKRYGVPEGASEDTIGGFVVLAMGKLGSREMRFGSDLDLAFVHGTDGTTAGGKSHYEFYTRLAQKLSSLLTSLTQFGKLYEIDHRLRPFGSKGILVPSLKGFTDFLEEADVWNFQAFTRLRPLQGDMELGKAILKAIETKWRERKKPGREIAQSVQDMLFRLVAENTTPAMDSTDQRQLKFSPGGMIGFEFMKQFLTLLHRAEGQSAWTDDFTHEKITLLEPDYQLINRLDERLSFYHIKFEHIAGRDLCTQLARAKPDWAFEHVVETMDRLNREIENCFKEYLP